MTSRLFNLVAVVICLAAGSTSAEVTRGRFTYYFDHPRHIEAVDSTLRSVDTRLSRLLQRPMSFPADIYLVASQERFDSLIGGHFPDWGAAAAIPFWKRIVIKSPDTFTLNRSLTELLSHEYAHLALADRTGLNSVPRWFDEGFAMIASMQWSWSDNLAMNLAAVTGDFIPLREIQQVNRFGQAKARLAYAESYLTVQYLYDSYGGEAVNIFLDEIAAGESVDRALLMATGSNYDDFEKEIRLYLFGRFNLAGLVADTMYFWFGLALVVVVGFVLTRLRRQRYYRKWEEAEKLHSTDFDYGDSDHPEEIDDDEPWRQ